MSYPISGFNDNTDNNVKTFCVISDYVLSTKSTYSLKSTGDDNDDDKSAFIANCKYYVNSSPSIKCDTCNDGYVLREDGSECLGTS